MKRNFGGDWIWQEWETSMGDCVKSGLGTTLCKYGMYILKVGHPQVLKSWWAFSYFHFVSSFCRSIYHSVVSRSSRFTVSSFRFVVLALELRWAVNNSAVIHIDSMLHESVGQFARIPATLPESWSEDFIPWLFSPFQPLSTREGRVWAPKA